MFHFRPYPAVFSVITFLACTIPLHSQELDGFAEPYREIEVAASEMGTISELKVQEGDVVTAGQVLASLNDQVLQTSLELAREAMSVEGKLNSAQAEMNLQQQRHNKMLGLRERRHASQVEVDRTAAQLEIATAQFQAVNEELRIKQLEYRRIQAQLEQRRIKSPIQGIVTLLKKDQGEFVSPTDPVVAKVVQLDPLLVVFSVPKDRARELRKDQQVPVIFDNRNAKVRGIVEFVSPTADAQSGTTRVKVRVPNPKLELQSGDGCSLAIFGFQESENFTQRSTGKTQTVSVRKR